MPKPIDNLNREIKENKAIYGSKSAIKQVLKGTIEKIYITNDAPLEIEEKLNKLKDKVQVIKLNITKEALKELCKVPFNISVISIIKSKIKDEQKEMKEKKQEGKKNKEKGREKKKNDKNEA